MKTTETIYEKFERILSEVFQMGDVIDEKNRTNETIEDWQSAASDYNELAGQQLHEIEGIKILELCGAQPFKGMPRSTVFVADFGDVRFLAKF